MTPEAGRTALAYLRVSVVGSRAVRGRLESPELQRNAIDLWCQSRGIEVVGEYRDLNRSGGTLTRPGLISAVEQLLAGVADGIVVAESSRAARNVIGALDLIDRLEKAEKWIAATDGTLDTSDATRRMATIMFMAQDEFRIRRQREQSAVIHERAVMEKRVHMGPTPFGYRRLRDGRLDPDPVEAPFLVAALQMRADRIGWATIVRSLNAQGARQRNGRPLNAGMLRRLARRRVYLGEAYHGSHVLADAHAPLIDEGLYAAVQRAEGSVSASPQIDRVHPESVLRGLMRCSGCRYMLKRLRTRGSPARWRCWVLVSDGSVAHDCSRPAALTGRESEAVEQLVIDQFFALAGEQGATRVGDDASLSDLERRLADAEGLLDELSDLEVRRTLGATRWREMVAAARGDVDRISVELAAARSRRSASIGDRRSLEQAWAGMVLAERQQALGNVIKAVMVDAGDGPLAGRVHVIPIWEEIDIPRRGQRDFVARSWTPGEV